MDVKGKLGERITQIKNVRCALITALDALEDGDCASDLSEDDYITGRSIRDIADRIRYLVSHLDVEK